MPVISSLVSGLPPSPEAEDKISKFIEGASTTEAIVPYDPEFAAKQLIQNGKASISAMNAAIPEGTPNTFVPSGTIPEVYKYQFDLGGASSEFKWHAPDANALAKYGSSSYTGTVRTAQITINGMLLGLDRLFYPQQMGNITHIPIGP